MNNSAVPLSPLSYYNDLMNTSIMRVAIFFIVGAVAGFLVSFGLSEREDSQNAVYVAPEYSFIETVELLQPSFFGTVSIEEVLNERRTRRDFAETSLSLTNLSQLLWAAQGETDEFGHRTAPSAHAIYPITVFVAVSDVFGVAPGLYMYQPETHSLGLLKEGDPRSAFADVTQQPHPQNAPATLILSANYLKPLEYFEPESSKQVTLQESGHIGQNIYLQAEALDLAMVVMGGFDPIAAREMIGASDDENIVYLIPIGNRVSE